MLSDFKNHACFLLIPSLELSLGIDREKISSVETSGLGSPESRWSKMKGLSNPDNSSASFLTYTGKIK